MIGKIIKAYGIAFWIVVGSMVVYGLLTRCENEWIYRNCSGN